jgi:hypothetical protein
MRVSAALEDVSRSLADVWLFLITSRLPFSEVFNANDQSTQYNDPTTNAAYSTDEDRSPSGGRRALASNKQGTSTNYGSSLPKLPTTDGLRAPAGK